MSSGLSGELSGVKNGARTLRRVHIRRVQTSGLSERRGLTIAGMTASAFRDQLWQAARYICGAGETADQVPAAQV